MSILSIFFYCLASEHLKLLYKFDRPHAYPKAAEIKFLLQKETTDVCAALQQAAVKSWGQKSSSVILFSQSPLSWPQRLVPVSPTSHEACLPSPARAQKGSQEGLCCALTIKPLILRSGWRRIFLEDRASFSFSIAHQLQLQFGLHPATEQLSGYHKERD